MASQLTRDISIEIDHLLDALQGDWEDAVALARHWADADDFEQTDLVVEWPLTVDRQMRLRRYEERGQLSGAQLRRLQALRSYMHTHEHELAAVLGQGRAVADPQRPS